MWNHLKYLYHATRITLQLYTGLLINRYVIESFLFMFNQQTWYNFRLTLSITTFENGLLGLLYVSLILVKFTSLKNDIIHHIQYRVNSWLLSNSSEFCFKNLRRRMYLVNISFNPRRMNVHVTPCYLYF